jgi:hypothetical protein
MDTLKSSQTVRVWPVYTSVFPVLFAVALLWSGPGYANSVPRYMAAVKQEIVRMGFPLECRDSEGICTIAATAPQSETATEMTIPMPIQIAVDDTSSTIRMLITSSYSASDLSGEEAKRLLTLNHQLMTAKISLDGKTGTLTLSSVVNTDSNFDRKTFRSVLKGFIQISRDLKNDIFVQN